MRGEASLLDELGVLFFVAKARQAFQAKPSQQAKLTKELQCTEI